MSERDVKPITEGIFTRTLMPFPEASSAVKVVSKPLYWSEVEPVRGQRSRAPLDSVLAECEARGQTWRIRPMLGKDAPEWAKQLGAGPIPFSITEHGKRQTGTVSDVWDPGYQDAAAGFMAWLAAEVDADPLVALVFASAGMTWYAEPLIRTYPENEQALIAAGVTMEADAFVQKWQLDIMTPFTRTPVGLAYNPWQHRRPDGTIENDTRYMAEVMDHHIALFGERTVLQNNSIRDQDISYPRPMYRAFVERPHAVHQFQCAAAGRVGDEEATIRWAHRHLNATGVEHSGTLTEATYAELDAVLKGGA
jgi:hypothetical protein